MLNILAQLILFLLLASFFDCKESFLFSFDSVVISDVNLADFTQAHHGVKV